MKPETLPNPGQLRIVKNFDFKMSMQNDITIDLLFTKQKVWRSSDLIMINSDF